MYKRKIIQTLLILNLLLSALLLWGKLAFVHKIIHATIKSFFTPLLLAIFFFYIIKPLNHIFFKKGLNRTAAALLTLSITLFIALGIGSYFASYAMHQFTAITKSLSNIIQSDTAIPGITKYIDKYLPLDQIYKGITTFTTAYMQKLGYNLITTINRIIHTFSNLFLLLVILFYLLKDGHLFPEKVLCFVPVKYKELFSKIIADSDHALGAFVTGQAKVAFCLASMIFIGYKIIGMPDALLLSSVTFILGFIPFIGFLISMIVPIILALNTGFLMVIKLAVVFIIVQTLKGRVIVPSIMAHAMKIHPLTDIFLVIGAISLGGSIAAFAAVPAYAILKSILMNLYNCHYIKKL